MCADICIHSKESDNPRSNPHAHVLLTTRGISPDGSWTPKERKVYALDADGNRIPIIDLATGCQKIGPRNQKLWKRISVKSSDWNSADMAEQWRQAWAEAVNHKLNQAGINTRIDHRSYQRQGLDIVPTKHEGYAAREIERRGEISAVCEENRQIREWNASMLRLMSAEREIGEELHYLRERQDDLNARTERIIQRGNASSAGREPATRNRRPETGNLEFTTAEQGTGRKNTAVENNLPRNKIKRRNHPKL